MSGRTEFEYFSCVPGHVVQRYGTRVYIGVTRVAGGWEWDDEKIVPIPVAECARFRREYNNAVRKGALKKRTANDHEAYLKSLEPTKQDTVDTVEAPEESAPKEPVEKKKKSKKGVSK